MWFVLVAEMHHCGYSRSSQMGGANDEQIDVTAKVSSVAAVVGPVGIVVGTSVAFGRYPANLRS